jgi:hypothetical protein
MDVLEGFFHVARANEEVHPAEEQFLGFEYWLSQVDVTTPTAEAA